MSAHPELITQSQQFKKQIIELSPGVYGAIGFSASNVYMLIGTDGLIIFDTTESTKAAENVFSEFRKITDKPVKTIVYTHSHRDHISGATIFAEGSNPEIIASDNFESDLVDVNTTHPKASNALLARTKRQFGMGLSFPDERVNIGIGPGDRPMEGVGAGHMTPTLSITHDRTTLTRCGFELELVKAPGETPDHIVVWLAEHRILFSGDNFYSTFPNLYAIRGTPYRDFNAWADTLNLLLSFDAEILAPGHTMPVIHAANVKEALTDYRDAINFIVSETVAGMNKQQGPDELAHSVVLPEKLANKPYLKEFYGKVSWSVRAYFAGTLGWFDGNPTSLAKLSPKDAGARIMRLAGGSDNVLATAQLAAHDNDNQWVLELSDHLLAANEHIAAARILKVTALRAMAALEINATARNYYLVSAYEIEQS